MRLLTVPADGDPDGPAAGGPASPGRAPVPVAAAGAGPAVEAVLAALRDPGVGLLTLMGPGGVGKSRLADDVLAVLRAAGAHVGTVDLSNTSAESALPAVEAALAAASAAAGGQAAAALPQDGPPWDRPAPHPLAPQGADRDRPGPYVLVENLERIRSRARELGAVLAAHPQVTVVATSRAGSGLSCEHRHRVGPLPLAGDPRGPGAPQVQGSRGTAGAPATARTASELFLRHARRVTCEPDLDTQHATVAAICRRLDGLPLALILAAEQLGAMTAGALLARLQDGWSPDLRGPVDLPERHATLARVLEADVACLSPAARSLFRLLGTFEGPVAMSAVSEVSALSRAALRPGSPSAPRVPPADTPSAPEPDDPAPAGPGELWAAVSELAVYSLITPVTSAEGTAEITYTMTSTTRDYARRLLDADEVIGSAVRAAHDDRSHRQVLEGAEALGTRDEAWLHRIDAELPDITATLHRFLAAGDERGLDLAAALRGYWLARGLLQEGLEWLDRAMRLPVDRTGPGWVRALEARAVVTGAVSSIASVLPDLEECAARWQALGEPVARARTLVDLAAALFEVHGFDRAAPVFQEAVATLDEAGDRWWAARARSLYGASAATIEAHRELAMETLDRAVEGFRTLGDSSYTSVPLQQLGRLLHETRHDVQATALLTEGLNLSRQADDAWNTSVFLNLLADVDLSRGNIPEAAGRYVDSLRLAAQIGGRPRFIWCLEGLAACMDDLGETAYAARLVGLAQSVRSALGLRDWVEFPARAIDLSSVRSRLARPVFARLCAEGAAMTVGDVLEYAPQLLATKQSAGVRKGRRTRFPDGLTSREVQVLRLIASGATSRAIASELFISIETVGRHISNLYRKINVSGRAEATAYAIRSGVMEE